MNTPTLHTPRLILRRFTPADIGPLYEILGDETVNTFLPWFPARSRADAADFCRRRIAPA